MDSVLPPEFKATKTWSEKKLAFSRIHTQINKYFFLNFLKVCQNQTNRNNNNRG